MTTTDTQEITAADVQVIGRPVADAALAAFENRLLDVPEAGGEGIDALIAAIASATSVDEIDAPWQSNGLGIFANRPIQINSIERIESTFADSPIGWFLVVRGADAGTGEAFVATTGSVNVVAQLTQLHHLDAFPVKVVLRQKESKKNPGAFVQHLDVVRK